MDHTPFIIAAFGLTGLGMAWLSISSFVAMRRAEALSKDLTSGKDSGR